MSSREGRGVGGGRGNGDGNCKALVGASASFSEDHGSTINAEKSKKKTGFKYMECLKNHAAAIGGNARDGCGEFLAAGEEGTIEALKCSACNCHRNFHRKIHIQKPPAADQVLASPQLLMINSLQYHRPAEEAAAAGGDHQASKKRFRTKFTQEQKEKMQEFAEKSGWKIQKLGESEVKRFCQEIGVKRKVLKVWMHNNKYHNVPKKVAASPNTTDK